jgi:hypothetical protein
VSEPLDPTVPLDPPPPDPVDIHLTELIEGLTT